MCSPSQETRQAAAISFAISRCFVARSAGPESRVDTPIAVILALTAFANATAYSTAWFDNSEPSVATRMCLYMTGSSQRELRYFKILRGSSVVDPGQSTLEAQQIREKQHANKLIRFRRWSCNTSPLQLRWRGCHASPRLEQPAGRHPQLRPAL